MSETSRPFAEFLYRATHVCRSLGRNMMSGTVPATIATQTQLTELCAPNIAHGPAVLQSVRARICYSERL
eukprot:6172432-Pleurochrysis_carterae.AAC.1